MDRGRYDMKQIHGRAGRTIEGVAPTTTGTTSLRRKNADNDESGATSTTSGTTGTNGGTTTAPAGTMATEVATTLTATMAASTTSG